MKQSITHMKQSMAQLQKVYGLAVGAGGVGKTLGSRKTRDALARTPSVSVISRSIRSALASNFRPRT